MNRLKQLTALTAILAAAPMLAQESVGAITGTARDKEGKPLAGIQVAVSSPNLLGGERVTTTDATGQYRIGLLVPGDYSLRAGKEGWIGQRASFRLGGGQTLRQDVVLAKQVTEEVTVEVVGIAASVDKTDTKTSSLFSLDQLQSLPTGSLNSYGALAAAPGVVSRVNGISFPVVRGGVTGQTQFTVNGISVRDSVVRQGRQFEVVLDDLTEDIQVIQSPLNAKYGNVSGGIVNLVTKNGSNEFQGTLRVKLSKSSARSLFSSVLNRAGTANSLAGTAAQSDSLTRTYEISVTGPIIKDKLTFSYGARLAPATIGNTTLTNLVTLGLDKAPFGGISVPGFTYGATSTANVVVSGPQTTSTQQLKLFYQINTDHQVEAFYTKDSLDFFDAQSGNLDTFATFRQTSDRPFLGINYRGVLGPAGILEVKYGKKKSAVNFSSGPGDPITQRVWNSTATTIGTAGTGGTVLTNGDTAAAAPELRQAETFAANYSFFVQSHNLDVGFEVLKETSFLPPQFGPNSRQFFVPARLANGDYLVYNAVGSSQFANATLRNGNSYIAELRTAQNPLGTGTGNNIDQTRSIYVNDQWTLNSHWSFMGGLRYDNWTVKDPRGTQLDTKAVSPRLEVKWDPSGVNRDVYSFSYAHFRGTVGQGNLGGFFGFRPGGLQARRFWNQGSTTPYTVSKTTLLDPANYGLVYAFSDSYTQYAIDPSLKPEVAKEYTLNFRRSYPSGGWLRASLIYKDFDDLWYRKGINEALAVPDFTGSGLAPTLVTKGVLTPDPNGVRTFKSMELEWYHPLLRKGVQTVDLQGSYTLARLVGRTQWREGNVGSGPAVFYDEYARGGLNLDTWNPVGELPESVRHTLKTWVTYRVRSTSGILTEVTLLGTYFSGVPTSLTGTLNIPAAAGLVATTNTPSTVTSFYNGRGNFRSPEVYFADFQWNTTIPVSKKIKFFSYVSIFNIFNSRLTNNVARTADSTARAFPETDPTFAATTFQNFGRPNQLTGNRSVTWDLGLKF